MSETDEIEQHAFHRITEFKGSQFQNLVEGFSCPGKDGECGQLVRFTRLEGEETTECPRCGAQVGVFVEVDPDGGRDPTR